MKTTTEYIGFAGILAIVVVGAMIWTEKEYNRGYADGLAEGKKGECIAWETTEGFWRDPIKCIDRAPLGYRSAFDEPAKEISIPTENKGLHVSGFSLRGLLGTTTYECIDDICAPTGFIPIPEN